MFFKRASGIILHPTSLPGPDGIGDLGPEAYRWIDFLKKAGIRIWQILPLGPTGYGDSPYQSFSAFAGNPYLISPAFLLDEDLLTIQDLIDRPSFPPDRVDFGPVIQWKLHLLDRAFDHFIQSQRIDLQQEFDSFQSRESSWLVDFSIFMAIKESKGGVSWNNWPEELRKPEKTSLAQFKEEYSAVIKRHAFRQFLFNRQWIALRDYAHFNGIKIIGDVPIFVAYDSAEVWAHPELFSLDEKGLPTVVAGVPPDYFSTTGQLWGNPLYRWDVHKETGYAWWMDRLASTFKQVDIIRLDHFRGFAGYWEIPYGMLTAEIGKWVSGPGPVFFNAVQKYFNKLPIIAEDLGVITPDVVKLRDDFNLPGMKVLQFAFATDLDDLFLPHNYPTNCVAYTGTHDNDTTLGWYKTAPENEVEFCRNYLASTGKDISWDMIRCLWSSKACMTLATMQDFLSLDSPFRMNFPGHPSGNWTWRLLNSQLNDQLSNRILDLNTSCNRV